MNWASATALNVFDRFSLTSKDPIDDNDQHGATSVVVTRNSKSLLLQLLAAPLGFCDES